MLRFFVFVLSFSAGLISIAQVGIGQWRSLVSGSQGFIVDQSPNQVFLSHGTSIMAYDKETGEIDNWNSVNFLTDITITAMRYDENSDILFVGYDNGNLDLIRGNTIYNIPSIRLSNIIGLKSIQEFEFHNGLVYIATGFGVVVVNPEKNEVKETYYPTSSNYFVYDIAFYNNRIYVATENGIYSGLDNDPLLPAPGAWNPLSGIDIDARYSQIEKHHNRLFFLRDSDVFDEDSLFYLENNSVVLNPIFPIRTYNHLRNQNDTLLVSMMGGLKSYTMNLDEVMNIWQYPFDTYPQVLGTVLDGDQYWIADFKFGLVKSQNPYSAVSYVTEGPYRTGSYKMDLADGKLATVSGYIGGNGAASYNTNGVNTFENEQWTHFHKDIQQVLDTIFDYTSVVINPNNKNQVFFGTSSVGPMYEIQGEQIVNSFDENNSLLEKRAVFEDYYLVTGMNFDYNGNLWIGNSFCNEQLKCYTEDGEWYSYNLGSTGKNNLIRDLFVDYYNRVWIGTNGNGIIVYDALETPENPNDDRLKVLGTAEGNGALPNGEVNCLTMDFDEEIWIGTSTGLAVIYSPQNIWDGLPGEYDAQRILVERDGFVEILLGETPITDIEVDGGNRKWIATEGSGVFLVSEDGTEEIHHFTSQNSPLISDNVFDIELDHLSGEVFIGTELGLVSFRSDATYGDFEFSDVYAYPNPVRPDFTGNITILGVAFDSDVRITDVAGNLVYRTTSNGGTVIWDGKTTTGERVKSGVYFIWAGEKNDKGKSMTKLLFIN